MKAQFLVRELNYEHNIVFLEDAGTSMSITNDAEAVFKWVDENYSHAAPTPAYWRVVYKDTDNEWWEMVRVVSWDEYEPYMKFEKWHGIVWDALKGNVV